MGRRPLRPIFAVLNPMRTQVLLVLQARPHSLEEIRFMLKAEHDCEKRIQICDAIRYLRKRGIIKLNREYKFQLALRISRPAP